MKKMTLSRDDHQREEIQMLGHLLQEPEKCSVAILLLFHKNWIIVSPYIAWHFIAFLTQPAVPNRHCQGTTIFDFFCKTLFFAIFNSNFQPSPAAPDRHCQGTTRNLCTSDLSGVDGDPPQSHNHALPCQTFVLSSSFCSSSSTKDSEAGLSEHLQHHLHHLE